MREAAARELKEELGIEAEEFVELGRCDPLTYLVDSPSHLVLARGLSFTGQQQEGTETIRREKVSLDEAVRMAMDGRITHGASCVIILRTKQFLENS